MPVSKAQIKFIRSLHQKKYRQMYGKFLVEGDKSVRELLHSAFKIDAIYGLSGWVERYHTQALEIHSVSPAELAELSTHEQPDEVVAIAHIPDQTDPQLAPQGLYIACDRLNDPGNAGTIIRIADWFGATGVVFSENSVDIYNPKVVSAAKGSLFRMPVIYTDLPVMLSRNKDIPVIGTYMDGESIYTTTLPNSGILLIGNEANGIREELSALVTQRISIPAFGKAESLNAGVATGILMSEWRRQLSR
ncbi:MAG: RNA methyltransferase [Bacteroidetes bacterium]|nr:RNA methyltransferase [Bacteroidota bacterium]